MYHRAVSTITRAAALAPIIALVAALAVSTPDVAFAERGDCGQPASQGEKPLATDALRVLQAAVGLVVCSDFGPPCICDVDASGAINATDALRVLKFAVGADVTIDCGASCPGTSSTTTVPPGSTTTSSSTSSSTVSTVTSTTTVTTSTLDTVALGRTIYDNDCASCHRAGTHDPSGFASNLAGDGNKMVLDFGTLDEDMSGLVYNQQQIDWLAAFLDSL